MSSPSRSSPIGFSEQALCLPIITVLALSGCLGPEGTTSNEGVDVSASADGEESDTPCGPEFSLTLPTGPNDTGSPCDPLKGPKTCNHLCLPIEAGEESTKQGGGICVDVCFDDECPTDFRCNTMPWGEKLCLPNLSCGDLTYEGVCEGSTLTYCDYEGSVTRECSDTLGADAEPMTCAWVPGVGHDCVSASYATSQVACGSVPYEGLCDEMGQLVYCGANETGGETLISVDCAALGDGQVCARAEDGFSSCTPKGAKPCGAVTYFGHCEGQTLVQCNGGFLEERDCAEEGLMCAFQEDAVGFSCISPSSEEAKGTMSVSASFAFEKPLAGLAGLNLSAPIQVPIRNALVTVNKVLDDTEIARAYTDDAGTVTFELSTSEALIMRVLTLGHVDSHPFVVTDCPMDDCDGSAGNTYALESEAFSASEEHTTLALTLATLDSGVAGAFNIFEVLLRGTHFAVQHFGAVPPTHFARWLSGSSTICPGGTSCFLKDTLYITSSDADTDEFDDAVILHEYGHFLEHDLREPRDLSGGARRRPNGSGVGVERGLRDLHCV